MKSIITPANVRRIGRKLRTGTVPIPLTLEFGDLNSNEISQMLNTEISTNQFFPSNLLGYLGNPKSNGCTRFVPISTAKDTIVYYSLVWTLEDVLIPDERVPGAYGAWRTRPKKINTAKAVETGDGYYSQSFSKSGWFEEWSSFSELLTASAQRNDIGNFVLTSDIANFYDTIDVNRLCDKLLPQAGELIDNVHLLKVYLQYWDRRIKGYIPSSKGIPQEIISDSSRTLANFYLSDFDKSFYKLCSDRDITYLRWADDIVMFGKSRKQLEETLHQGSRILLASGLNFNASKTKHYSRSAYYKYRALDVIKLANSGTVKQYERAVKKFLKDHDTSGGRIDTVFRLTISKCYKNSNFRTPALLSFLLECSTQYELMGGLSALSIHKFVAIFDSPIETLKTVASLLRRFPYASTKAVFLESISDHHKKYLELGLTKSQLEMVAKGILECSEDSVIIKNFCQPRFTRVGK